MKPFDLEAAKSGKSLVTRNGESVRFAAHIPFASNDMRVVVVRPSGKILSYFEDGKYFPYQENRLDLFMGTAKRTVYVNFYKNHRATYYATEKVANESANHEAIAVAVPVEIEE